MKIALPYRLDYMHNTLCWRRLTNINNFYFINHHSSERFYPKYKIHAESIFTYADSLDEAKHVLDRHLENNGYVFMTESEYEKF